MPLNFRAHLMTLPDVVIPEFLDTYLDLVLDYPEVEGYTEGHHILPRSLFPAFAAHGENLVQLRGRDHLLAHYWLARAFPTTPATANAYLAMSQRDSIPAHKKLTRGHHLGSHDIPVPTEELLRQYEESREVWANHMKERLSVRCRVTGQALQIPREEFNPHLHENYLAGRASYRTSEGEVVVRPTDHPDVLSGKVRHINKGKLTAIDAQTGRGTHITREEYEENRGRYTLAASLASGHGKANNDCTPIRDEHDVFRWVPKGEETDANLASGLWRPHNKGQVTVRSAGGGPAFNVDVDDPRLLSGEVKHCSKGKATVRDIQGNTFQVDKDDPRIITGELVAQNAGRVRALDTAGREVRVYPDDRRLLSGELKLKDLKTKSGVPKVRGWDAEGREYRLWPDDPRLETLYRSKKEVPGWVDPRVGRRRNPR